MVGMIGRWRSPLGDTGWCMGVVPAAVVGLVGRPAGRHKIRHDEAKLLSLARTLRVFVWLLRTRKCWGHSDNGRRELYIQLGVDRVQKHVTKEKTRT